jgi:hypothetical protein
MGVLPDIPAKKYVPHPQYGIPDDAAKRIGYPAIGR